jgi:hypothetical protein
MWSVGAQAMSQMEELDMSQLSTVVSISDIVQEDTEFLGNFKQVIEELVRAYTHDNISIRDYDFVEEIPLKMEAVYITNCIVHKKLLFPSSGSTIDEIWLSFLQALSQEEPCKNEQRERTAQQYSELEYFQPDKVEELICCLIDKEVVLSRPGSS